MSPSGSSRTGEGRTGGPRLGAGGSAGRVIAGVARGRRLAAPGAAPGAVTRPLGDRMKQSLFAILEPEIVGSTFLDLFAGSGAGGIEALSRGAAHATFVEQHVSATQMVERNLRTTSLLGPRAKNVRAEVISWLTGAGANAGPFDVILVDPPYDQPGLLERSIEIVAAAGPGAILALTGVLAAKHSRRKGPPGKVGLLRSTRDERFGETMLTFYRWTEDE